jgi:HD-like signal output (HDOD) protein
MVGCKVCGNDLGGVSRKIKPFQLVGCTQCMNVVLIDWETEPVESSLIAEVGELAQRAPRGSVIGNVFDMLNRVIEELPVLPEVPQRVVATIHDPLSSIDDLVTIIEEDAVLSMKILSLANSAYFATVSEINDLNTACSRLGMKSIANIAHAVANANLYKTSKVEHRKLMEQLWTHAIATAYCADSIGQKVGLDSNTVFVGGLVHDIGKLVLFDALTNKYSGNIGRLSEDTSLLIKVISQFAPLAGLHVIQHWKLAPELAFSTLFSSAPEHNPSADWSLLSHAICLSNAAAEQIGFSIGEVEQTDLSVHPSIAALGLTEDWSEIELQLQDSIDSVLGVLGSI